jgi:molybdopterin converting factor subunit 1
MRVTVQFFARLREIAGGAREECEVAGNADVRDVWSRMTERHPALAPFSGQVSCALNADFARMSSPVHDGDEISFLPPVSGGGRTSRLAPAPPRPRRPIGS